MLPNLSVKQHMLPARAVNNGIVARQGHPTGRPQVYRLRKQRALCAPNSQLGDAGPSHACRDRLDGSLDGIQELRQVSRGAGHLSLLGQDEPRQRHSIRVDRLSRSHAADGVLGCEETHRRSVRQAPFASAVYEALSALVDVIRFRGFTSRRVIAGGRPGGEPLGRLCISSPSNERARGCSEGRQRGG